MDEQGKSWNSERDYPALARKQRERITKLEAALNEITTIEHSHRAARIAREALANAKQQIDRTNDSPTTTDA